MRRREFIAAVGGAAAWPLAAQAQQASVKQIGILQPQPESDPEFRASRMLFISRLHELGWTDGQNLQIHARFGTGEAATIAPIAKELVDLRPDVLLAITALAAVVLRQYTLAIPTVFTQVGDPVALGLVTNLARPNGNVTGFASFDYAIGGKWLELLKDTVTGLSWAAIFFEAGNPSSTQYVLAIEAAAAKQNVRLIPVPVAAAPDIATAFTSFTDLGHGCIIAVPVGIIVRQRKEIIAGAEQNRLAGMYPYRFFAAEGGLMSYGSDIGDQYRFAASYVDRILRGARPADLPVQEPTKLQLVVNLKTAKALGLQIPAAVLAHADEVIE